MKSHIHSMLFFRISQPPRQEVDSRRWRPTTPVDRSIARAHEAPLTADGSRCPIHSLRSALEIVFRLSLFDGRRLNVSGAYQPVVQVLSGLYPNVPRAYVLLQDHNSIYVYKVPLRDACDVKSRG